MQQNQLPCSFYDQDAVSLAKQLLGKIFAYDNVAVRIVETEAYMPQDSASHAYKGKTQRNAPMFSSGGVLYVYLCYGMHQMINIVSGSEGSPQAVLIRAGEVIHGADIVQKRRSNLDLNGPGKFAQGLGIDTSFSGERLDRRVHIWDAPSVDSFVCTPRIGIEYALPKDRDALWRFITPLDSPKKRLVRKKKG